MPWIGQSSGVRDIPVKTEHVAPTIIKNEFSLSLSEYVWPTLNGKLILPISTSGHNTDYHWFNSTSGVLDFKFLVTAPDYLRILDFPYMKLQAELDEFSQFITSLGIKKIQGTFY